MKTNLDDIITDIEIKEDSTTSTKCEKESVEKSEKEKIKKKARPILAVSHYLSIFNFYLIIENTTKTTFYIENKNLILHMVDYNDYLGKILSYPSSFQKSF